MKTRREAMMPRKPKKIQAGRAYRLYSPFSSQPSDNVALVTEIRPMTRSSRSVIVAWLLPGPPFDRFNYSEFMQRAHSEVPVQ